jgi:hypothetical protein
MSIDKRRVDHAEVSEGYRKARRNLVAVSSILLFWEFLGIFFDSNGKSGATFLGLKLGIKNPELLPLLLFIVSAYFLFRIWNEWNFLAFKTRANIHFRMDYVLSIVITVFSWLFFIIQSYKKIQITDQFKLLEDYKILIHSVFAFIICAQILKIIYDINVRIMRGGKIFEHKSRTRLHGLFIERIKIQFLILMITLVIFISFEMLIIL